jgi:hypothetical protein
MYTNIFPQKPTKDEKKQGTSAIKISSRLKKNLSIYQV